MLEIVRVGSPGPLRIECFLRVCVVLVESISLRVEDTYRILELCAGLISSKLNAMKL